MTIDENGLTVIRAEDLPAPFAIYRGSFPNNPG